MSINTDVVELKVKAKNVPFLRKILKNYVKNIAQLQILKTLIFVSIHKFNQLVECLKISEVKIETKINSVKKNVQRQE